jgi:uncharacterized protein YkwD
MRSFNSSAATILVFLAFLCAGSSSQAKTLVPGPSPELQSMSPEPKTIMLWRGEKWMLDYTNWVRQRFGAEPVIIDPKLQESCRRHCEWMARNNSMVHSNAPGENIAMGQSGVPQAMSTWEQSSGHFVNMVNRSHRVCGMACYQMPNGQRFFCQQFSH